MYVRIQRRTAVSMLVGCTVHHPGMVEWDWRGKHHSPVPSIFFFFRKQKSEEVVEEEMKKKKEEENEEEKRRTSQCRKELASVVLSYLHG